MRALRALPKLWPNSLAKVLVKALARALALAKLLSKVLKVLIKPLRALEGLQGHFFNIGS